MGYNVLLAVIAVVFFVSGFLFSVYGFQCTHWFCRYFWWMFKFRFCKHDPGFLERWRKAMGAMMDDAYRLRKTRH